VGLVVGVWFVEKSADGMNSDLYISDMMTGNDNVCTTTRKIIEKPLPVIIMTSPFLPCIDVTNYNTERQGLDSKTLSYFKSVHAILDNAHSDEALQHLHQTVGYYDTSFDVTAISSINQIISLLESGAVQVFVTAEQLRELKDAENINPSRIVLSLEAISKGIIEETCTTLHEAVHFHNVTNIHILESYVGCRQETDGPVYITLDASQAKMALQLSKSLKEKAILIIPATLLTVSADAPQTLISAIDLLLGSTESDRPDGLITTLVMDERGTTLGLVYSSKESVAASLRTGQGVYQSRKRGLWYKGSSSGDTQELVSIGLDCDRDCLRFIVRQKGRGEYPH